MDIVLNQDFQTREYRIQALISSVSEEDPELAESLKQTLSIIKHSYRFQTGELGRAKNSN